MDSIIQYLTKEPNLTNALATVASAVIALAALIVSAVSLYLGRHALKLQHKHNVLSVKPIPHIESSDYINNIKIRLFNNGSGPLIIKSIEVSGDKSTNSSLIEWMPSLPSGMFWDTFEGAIEGEKSLPSDGQLILLEFSGDPSDKRFCDFRDKCRDVLRNLKVVVVYTDIYNTKMKNYEKKLKWFGRDR